MGKSMDRAVWSANSQHRPGDAALLYTTNAIPVRNEFGYTESAFLKRVCRSNWIILAKQIPRAVLRAHHLASETAKCRTSPESPLRLDLSDAVRIEQRTELLSSLLRDESTPSGIVLIANDEARPSGSDTRFVRSPGRVCARRRGPLPQDLPESTARRGANSYSDR